MANVVQAQVLHGRGLSEPVDVKGDKWEIRRRMVAAGLDEDAAEFLAGYEPRRVELNAFMSQELIDIIEEGVNGDKLIPDDRRLGEAWAEMMVRAKVAAYEAEVRKQPPTPPLENLRQHVTAMTSSRPDLSWDEAVGICAQQVLEEGVSK